jgi:L-fucose isomerase-like protein
MPESKKTKLGFIPANRGFFSDALAAKMRSDTIRTLREAGAQVVVPSTQQTKIGCVETVEEAMLCGKMFREEQVDGIVVNCVNFGDEKGAAISIKESGRNVPILVVGCQEEEVLSPGMERRDSFCGLLSTCEGIRQLGLQYSVPEVPICYPSDESFRETARRFVGVARVVAGVRNARYGQMGARPNDFWTCRYNEKVLQRLGPTVVTLDLSEVFPAVESMPVDAKIRRTVTEMKKQMDTAAVSDEILSKIARFEKFCRDFIEREKLDGLGIQCWTSIQANLGICACTTMSRLNDRLIPCACEADMMGTLSMHALQLASQDPACLADWNNVHNDDPELVNCWHCGVFPMSWAKETPRMGCQEIVAGATGRENAMGVTEFVMQDGPVTLARATQDTDGRLQVALAEGVVEPNPATTFGSYGWVRIPGIQRLYREVLLRHFPHHVAMTRAHVGNVLWEALGNYLGFEVYTAERTAGTWTPALPFHA